VTEGNWSVEVVTRKGGKVVNNYAVVEISRERAIELRDGLAKMSGCAGPMLEVPQ